jgi:predicted small metal-binding protein
MAGLKKHFIILLIAYFILAFLSANQVYGREGGGHGSSSKDMWENDFDNKPPQRTQVKSTSKMQKKYSECIQSFEFARSRIKEMNKSAKAEGLDIVQAKQYHKHMRKEVDHLKNVHGKFLNSLNEEQRKKIKNRILTIEQIQDQIRNHLEVMDRETLREEPNTKEFFYQSGKIDEKMMRWQNEYQKTASDLDIKPEQKEVKKVKKEAKPEPKKIKPVKEEVESE